MIHVRGKIRARQTFNGLLSPAAAVFRRTVFVVGGVRLVHEAAVDFSLVDDSGEAITILAADARLLATDGKRHRLDRPQVAQLAALQLPEKIGPQITHWLERDAAGKRTGLLHGGEVLLTDGAEVQVVGMKTRVVDPTVQSRLERETPMRATLQSSNALPLLIAAG